jgi:hypothetical protein
VDVVAEAQFADVLTCFASIINRETLASGRQKFFSTGLLKFNAQEQHIILKDPPEGRTCVYTYRRGGGRFEFTRTLLFSNNAVWFYCWILNASNVFAVAIKWLYFVLHTFCIMLAKSYYSNHSGDPGPQ